MNCTMLKQIPQPGVNVLLMIIVKESEFCTRELLHVLIVWKSKKRSHFVYLEHVKVTHVGMQNLGMPKLQNSPKLPHIHARFYCNANEQSRQ